MHKNLLSLPSKKFEFHYIFLSIYDKKLFQLTFKFLSFRNTQMAMFLSCESVNPKPFLDMDTNIINFVIVIVSNLL